MPTESNIIAPIHPSNSIGFSLINHIRPMIKQPPKTTMPEAYYDGFERARLVLAHPVIIALLQECANHQFNKYWSSNRPLLMESSTDLVGECYRGLLVKVHREGLTCNNFEEPSFNPLNWLKVVFSNQAKDRLRFKVPNVRMYSIEASKEER